MMRKTSMTAAQTMLMLLKISSGTGENLLSETGTSHSSFYPKSQLLTIAICNYEFFIKKAESLFTFTH